VGTLWHSCAKVCERIKLPFAMVSGVGPVIGILDDCPHPKGEGEVWGLFDVSLLIWDLLTDFLFSYNFYFVYFNFSIFLFYMWQLRLTTSITEMK